MLRARPDFPASLDGPRKERTAHLAPTLRKMPAPKVSWKEPTPRERLRGMPVDTLFDQLCTWSAFFCWAAGQTVELCTRWMRNFLKEMPGAQCGFGLSALVMLVQSPSSRDALVHLRKDISSQTALARMQLRCFPLELHFSTLLHKH